MKQIDWQVIFFPAIKPGSDETNTEQQQKLCKANEMIILRMRE